MRSFTHWTPRYLFDRSLEKLYRYRHPDLPWLTPFANQILASYLQNTDHGAEFGSGRSTIWLSKHVASLVSIEHNPLWYEKVRQELEILGKSNVTYLFRPQKIGENPVQSDYVSEAHKFADCSLDFALVDGIYRDACVCALLNKIVPGGVLIIDNINLYLPSASRCPNSIRPDAQPATPLWEQAYTALKQWRCIWTSNGISDTAIFFKPCQNLTSNYFSQTTSNE
ncbi:MAG: hypothetical protein WHV66_15645 [Anaerolineales bacterium]